MEPQRRAAGNVDPRRLGILSEHCARCGGRNLVGGAGLEQCQRHQAGEFRSVRQAPGHLQRGGTRDQHRRRGRRIRLAAAAMMTAIDSTPDATPVVNLDAWLAANGPLAPGAALVSALEMCSVASRLTDSQLKASIDSLRATGIVRD